MRNLSKVTAAMVAIVNGALFVSASWSAQIPYIDGGANRSPTRNITNSELGGTLHPTPTILVGDPVGGTPPVTPLDRLDSNVGTSGFAGVVSLLLDFGGGLGGCSGSVVSSMHVVTAAHCVDFSGGTDPNGFPTGDGVVDALTATSTVNFNHAGSLAASLSLSAIDVHPDWHGFNNIFGPEGASINDDVAVLTLSAPIPTGVPIYQLNTAPVDFVETVMLAGYGETGNAITGYTPNSFSLNVKRTGQNLASVFAVDDESPFTEK